MTKLHTYIFVILFTLLSVLLYFIPLSFVWDLRTLDAFRQPHPPHTDIVILAIDNKSIAKIGRWPWSRTVDAKIVTSLKAFEPSVVGFDITFSEVDTKENDVLLAQSIRQAPFPVVLTKEAIFINGSSTPQSFITPLPGLTTLPNVSVGHTIAQTDPDGQNRFFPVPFTTHIPFALTIGQVVHAQLPTKDSLISFAGNAGSFPTYSMSDFLENTIPKEKLQNKIILIGATASDLHDIVHVPSKNPIMSGIEWQANVLDNVLLQRAIQVVPRTITLFIALCMALLYVFLFPKISSRKMSYGIVAVLVLLALVSFVLLQLGFAFFFFTPFLIGLGLFIFNSIYRWYLAEVEKRRIKQTFSPYFSPSILEAILEDPKSLELGGKRKVVTVFFSDIRNFTTITETLSPEKLTTLLHEYFTEMTKAILETDGVVDKFIGDAIMAFWGAPLNQTDQADRAVTTAIHMRERLTAAQKRWQQHGYPLVEIGIGINTGEVIVGNMGSKNRFDYTVIGDAVNIASRLEGLNKEYKTHIIISESTKQKLTKKVTTKHLGSVLVKGKTKPVDIYSVF